MSQATSSRRETLQVAIRGDLRRVARETGANTAVDMTAERERSLDRQEGRLFERRARALLAVAGWSADRAALEEAALKPSLFDQPGGET